MVEPFIKATILLSSQPSTTISVWRWTGIMVGSRILRS